METVLLPALGGPADGLDFPVTVEGTVYVFDEYYGVAHAYREAVDDGERIYRYAGPESLESAQPDRRPLAGWRV